MRATLKNYRQSPRKVRLVADVVRGQAVPRALNILRVLDKRASLPLYKLLCSAVENAKQAGKPADDLRVERIIVNEGMLLKRYRPRAFGRSAPLRKRTSTVHITLG